MPPALACSLLLLVLLASAASAAPSPWGTSTESLGWGLDEENCPYVTPEVLDAFIWRGASGERRAVAARRRSRGCDGHACMRAPIPAHSHASIA